MYLNVYLKKYLLTLSLFVGLLTAGSLHLTVNKQSITPGEGVVVSLIAEGENIIFPTIKDIAGLPISNKSISQNVQATFANGAVNTLRQKTMRFTLFPKSKVTIPALKVTIDGKTEHSQPITIKILKKQHHAKASSKYDLRMLANRHSVYTGEPLLVQVVFFEPINSDIAQAQYAAPKFEGFFVKASPDERLEQKANGTAHVFDYILTPQKEGNFTITAPQIKIGVRTFSGARDPWGFFNNELRWYSLQGKDVTVRVKSIPPSADLVGKFQLKATVDTHKVHANKPVNYTLSLNGMGSLDDMDAPEFNLPDVTVYSDDPESLTQVKGKYITSQWTRHYTFIADHDFTIPPVTFKVFNPKTKKITMLSSKPVKIHILEKSSKKSFTTPVIKTARAMPKPVTGISKKDPEIHQDKSRFEQHDSNLSLLEDTQYYLQQSKNKFHLPWWSLILTFILGAVMLLIGQKIISLFARRSQKNTKKRKYSIDEALHILYPRTNDSPEIEAMVRELYRVKKDPRIPIDREKLKKIIEKL